MRIARRTFLAGTVVLAAAPVFANRLMPPSDAALALVTVSLEPLGAAGTTGLVFKIDGWSDAEAGTRHSAPDEMWFTVSRSWRAAWR